MQKVVAAIDVAALWVAAHPKTTLALLVGTALLAVLF